MSTALTLPDLRLPSTELAAELGIRDLIPAQDRPWFGNQTPTAREKLLKDLAICHWIDAATQAGAKKADIFGRKRTKPQKGWEPGILDRLFRGVAGYTGKSLERRYYTWIRSGRRPHALLDQAKSPPRERARLRGCYDHKAFGRWFQQLVANAGGNLRRAWDLELLPIWENGMHDSSIEVPGYGNPRRWLREHPSLQAPHSSLPIGWTYSNLGRLFKLEPIEKTTIAIGRQAARNDLQGVATTRIGTYVGAVIFLDEMWHNIEVLYGGQPVRPLELAFLDLCSGSRFLNGRKPRVVNAATGRYSNIAKAETRFLIAAMLATVGIHPAGTTLIAEHGATGIAPDLEEILRVLAPELRICRDTIKRQAINGAFFEGPARGNPRFKARLEGDHNYRQSAMTDFLLLPGQTGRNSRVDRPEQLEAQKRYTAQLIAAAEEIGLPDHLRVQLKSPLVSWGAWQNIVGAVYRAVERTCNHRLEGWEQCGFMVQEFRVALSSPDWMPISALAEYPRSEQEAIYALARSNPKGYFRERRLSRSEVWNLGAVQLRRLPGQDIAQVLDHAYSRPCRVSGGYLTLGDNEVCPSPMQWSAHITEPDGTRVLLRDGQQVVLSTNPFDLTDRGIPARAYIHDKAGRYLGEARARFIPNPLDDAALHRGMGMSASLRTAAEARIDDLTAPLIATRQSLLQHNASILERGRALQSPPPEPPQEKPAARRSTTREQAAFFGGFSQVESDTQP
jgi:hypothetical protein